MNRPRSLVATILLASASSWILPACIVEGSAGGTLYTPPPPSVGATVAVTAQPPPQPPPQTVTVQAQVAVPANVVVLEQRCQQGAPEQCNGIDDNCNGAIDEGCGYQSGQIQVTAAWNGPSDIDLHVTDPMGEEVYYGHRNSASGGVLDHDANAACNGAQPTVENVYWSSPNPPRGQYRVRVHAYAMCGMPQTPVTLSVSVGGRVIGTYQYTMTHQGDAFELPFQIQ